MQCDILTTPFTLTNTVDSQAIRFINSLTFNAASNLTFRSSEVFYAVFFLFFQCFSFRELVKNMPPTSDDLGAKDYPLNFLVHSADLAHTKPVPLFLHSPYS